MIKPPDYVIGAMIHMAHFCENTLCDECPFANFRGMCELAQAVPEDWEIPTNEH